MFDTKTNSIKKFILSFLIAFGIVLIIFILCYLSTIESTAEIRCIIGHTWVDATCTTPKTCLVCEKTEGSKLGHKWEGGDCTTESICVNCGASGDFKHTYSSQACNDIYCDKCGEFIQSGAHKYNADGICKYCGKENESKYTDSNVDYKTVTDDDDDFWYAVTAAQNLVKDELKSPSTAKFPYDDAAYVIKRSGDYWIVGGYVDAQNAFGTSVREEWIATFKMGDTSGSQYKISDFAVMFL